MKIIKKIKKARFKKPQDKPPETLPRITNDTVAEEREEVLSSARKYIYPLQHSKHKIVILTVSIVLVASITFFTYCVLALYRFRSTSAFIYKATQVIPFPIARQGGKFIAYENYLFEVRRYQHYYESQQKLDFNSDFGRQQLIVSQRQALDKVIDDAYIRAIAKEQKISVSDREVEDQIVLLRNQERLGSSDEVLDDVLREYFGWTRADFKRYAHNKLLREKVLHALDSDNVKRAESALAELKGGAKFEDVAKQYSDDVTTKDKGGEFGFLIEKSNRGLSPRTIGAVFALQPGQISDIIQLNDPASLEIYKLIELVEGGKAKASHITFNFKDINIFLNDRKEKTPTRTYIRLPEPDVDAPQPQKD